MIKNKILLLTVSLIFLTNCQRSPVMTERSPAQSALSCAEAMTSFVRTNTETDSARLVEKIFVDNYSAFYSPRHCGENITRLVEAAEAQNIDLSNAYVARIEGAGFLETSGFYSREVPNEWKMLGYFHFVLVIDNKVYDFDLYGKKVVSLEEYVRLQFTPPTPDYKIGNLSFKPESQLNYWTVKAYSPKNIGTQPELLWQKKLTEVVDIEQVLRLDRDDLVNSILNP